ncbi:L-histidine N(alpha)-methyltransferase [Lewinella sp. W8]|uniref:L-histidine N(alpha)-methyltransferase n=1 Tax=Lewinella sp. W8 TaxID=2528208 RepID=UPI0010674AD7|nr:L-histidine N(alpha)-methyltransferase [Lewinella sp. W8]MTB49377.1 L-histidine N(alpha)-methyltransferase [Lewinella sp. W8]
MINTQISAFAADVFEGLASTPRRLSSKWFYDERGDALFQQIMGMPEYYLTDCELEIFQTAGPELLDAIGNRSFDLIELGAGDGTKTQFLIEQFLAAGANFTYRPIDISAHAIEILGNLIRRRWPTLPFKPVQDDYFSALDRLGKSQGDHLRLVLFPGANIGNFAPEEAVQFLRHLRKFLREDDLLLVGFDLKKDPAIILAAYNDPAGYTAAFNLNLLRRINEELGADFRLDQWKHWETYNPVSGATRSYLVSLADQSVRLPDYGRRFRFDVWEPIEVEISQKYNRPEIEAMLQQAGFTFLRHLEDSRGYFSDALARV